MLGMDPCLEQGQQSVRVDEVYPMRGGSDGRPADRAMAADTMNAIVMAPGLDLVSAIHIPGTEPTAGRVSWH